MMTMSTAERLERHLAVEILRGERVPATHLPSVRQLAAEFSTTIPTIQRVLARLEMTGLVTVSQGRSTVINDPQSHGSLALLPLWVASHRDRPAEAERLVDDFLALRRTVAAGLMVGGVRPPDALADVMAAAVEEAAAKHPGDFMAADLYISRRVIDATGNRAALFLLNTFDTLLREVPALAEAMYGAPTRNLEAMHQAMAALRSGKESDAIRQQILVIFENVDAETLRRFGTSLRSGTR